ncbi:amino acid carrier protein [Halothece sp. PCC 7418]|uniref:Alanine or glycine:cation symporter 1 n=1 Tax=Aphanothece halophytica TaxID=72020 RepID=A0A0B6VK38_APHHA|nr:alanine/glycine:cation symporter family protein [Halothece sp. PCC 7418]AFZ44248.1 amino acid carrier protein [Halothece sp. PCC 7418]BAQ19535.1 alanine or glycine:cation symporter 1 [Aphanothece halophytica]
MFDVLNNLIWSKLLIVLLIGIGLTFTIRSRFVQFRYLGLMLSNFKEGFNHEEGHLSSFQALALSVAGRVGAGNIAGVAVAITLGGPGAIFWMWLIGLIGMATSFFECTLSQVFKRAEPDGTYRGGPAYYIEQGLNQRWLAAVFSVLLLVTFGLGFNALQSYTVAASVEDTFGLSRDMTAFIMMGMLGAIIFGGVKRIAHVAEYIVPVMAIGYFLMSLAVIITNLDGIPSVFATIIRNAFGFDSAITGGIGAAIIFGVKRGLFSNEAGLGSAPNVAAVAYVKHPVNQGMLQSISVFIDTMVLCTCTAAVILLSGVYEPGAEVNGVTLTQNAMSEQFGFLGQAFVTFGLALFAFTSMLYNYYLGENSLNFFSEENHTLFNGFRVLTLALIIWGATQDLTTVFGFADLTMGLLALVNLAALVMLFGVGLKVLHDFEKQLRSGKQQPLFTAASLPEFEIDAKAWPHEPSEPEPTVERVEAGMFR